MHMEQLKISIIVPVYNTEKYLAQCLESLINQTLREIEIICVNDGSKDKSLSILKTYRRKDSRIKIINQKNAGVGKSRNNAIKIAKGEFIGFTDGDDWVDKDFFENLYNTAIKYNCEIASGDFYRQGKFLKSKKLKYKKTEAVFEPAEKIKNAFIPKYNYVWNKIYKREAIQNIHFPENCYYEDMRWLVKIIDKLKGFVTVPDTYYHYRKNDGSIVTQKSLKHMNDRIIAEKEMQNYMKQHNIPVLVPYKLYRNIRIKILGFNIFKIEFYYPNKISIKLFGFISLIKIERNF